MKNLEKMLYVKCCSTWPGSFRGENILMYQASNQNQDHLEGSEQKGSMCIFHSFEKIQFKVLNDSYNSGFYPIYLVFWWTNRSDIAIFYPKIFNRCFEV